MGTAEPGWFMRLCALTTPSRLLSIRAATIRDMIFMTCPIPICWIGVRVWPVRFLYLRLKTKKEAAGILKCGPRCLSMVRA